MRNESTNYCQNEDLISVKDLKTAPVVAKVYHDSKKRYDTWKKTWKALLLYSKAFNFSKAF